MRINIKAKSYDLDIIKDLEHLEDIFEEVYLMPDTHRGKQVPVGFVANLNPNKVIPYLIGVDIGCGISFYPVPKEKISCVNWENIHNKITTTIPSGRNIHKEEKYKYNYESLKIPNQDLEYYNKSLGTLGGGNHFIEISEGKECMYILVHTGSRRLGKDICTYYSNILESKKTKTYSEYIRNNIQDIPFKDRQSWIEGCREEFNKKTPYLEGQDSINYIMDMRLAQQYASLNRKIITKEILKILDIEYEENLYNESIHNYISDDLIIRKGATNAHKGERVIIPISMKEGSILGVGLGNKDWNFSSPHGAGRVMSRSQAHNTISLEEYQESMKDTGVTSFSINKHTIDEAPMVYRSMEEILETVHETITVLDILKPVFNFKGGQ